MQNRQLLHTVKPMSLTEYIALASKQRCLPNQLEADNPASLLGFLSIAQVRDALETGNRTGANPLQILIQSQPTSSKQYKLLSYLSVLTPNPIEFCQLLLLEREASRLPDAFAQHCLQLRSSLECYPQRIGASVKELVELKRSLGTPETWANALAELVLAPSVKPETVEFFLKLFDQVKPGFSMEHKLTDSVAQLNDAITRTAGPEKMKLAMSVGVSASISAVVGEVNSTLMGFLRNAMCYDFSEDDQDNYQLLELLFNPHPDQGVEWIAGTYLYLTGRASQSGGGGAAPLPQLMLHSMLSDMLTSLSRTLLGCVIPATFMQRFSGADFQPVLDRLSALNKTLCEVSELLAVPRSNTFSACAHLFSHSDTMQCGSLWTYTHSNSPWSSGTNAGQLPSGAFGTINSGSRLASRLKFSDCSIYLDWSGIAPFQHTPEDAMMASPILQQLADISMADSLLSERMTASLDMLSLPSDPSTLGTIADADTGADGFNISGWDDDVAVDL